MGAGGALIDERKVGTIVIFRGAPHEVYSAGSPTMSAWARARQERTSEALSAEG